MKLGRLPVKYDDRTLMLHRYLDKSLPSPPEESDWASAVKKPWGEMKNDVIGDCTCAAIGHQIMVWTANALRCVKPTDSQILKAYKAVSGYDGTEETDKGATCLDVLNYMRKVGIGTHKISAFVKLTQGNITQLKDAIAIFGTAYLGMSLPLSAEKQVGGLWDTGPNTKGKYAVGSWGGHAIPAVSYDKKSVEVITWGESQLLTYDFYQTYCDEAYVQITPDWIKKNGSSPSGFNLQLLADDLNRISSQGLGT